MAAIDWASVLSGGVVGGAIGAWAAARRERSTQLRDRMLDVADAYVVTLGETVGFIGWLQKPEIDEAERRLPKLDVLVARIELLFAPDSAVAVHAAEAVLAARIAIERRRELDKPADRDSPARSLLENRLDQGLVKAEREYRAFARSASYVIRIGGRHPWRERVARRARNTLFVARHPKIYLGLRRAGAQHARSLTELEAADYNYRQAVEEARRAGVDEQELEAALAEARADEQAES